MSIDSKNNKSICPYPFTHSYIGSRYERKLCCVAQDIPELEKTTLDEYWNSDKLKETRLKMLKGEPVSDCRRCYEFEKLNIESLRETSCNENDLDIITRNMQPDGTMTVGPNYFDHRTIHCNLQCISCGYHYSSTHIKLRKEMWNVEDGFQIDYEYEDQEAEDIIQSILKKECNYIYWAGGEPMSSHVHWKVVDKMCELLDNPEYTDYVKNIRVHYNTNMTKSLWKGKSIPQLLEFHQPSIQASIDGTHETFEYTRDGGKWDEVSKNWHDFFTVLNKNKQSGVATVLSAPVIFDIDRWFEFFEPYNPIIYNHKYLCDERSYPQGAQSFLDIRLFPKEICERVVNHAIKRFEGSNLRGKERTVSVLQSYIVERENMKVLFENQHMLKEIKKKTEYRDKFLKTNRQFKELLKIIDIEAYNWYINL
jgi:hypothetical protein